MSPLSPRAGLLYPSLAFVLAVLASRVFGTDLWLADHVYLMEGGHWAFRDAWTTEQLIHHGGRDVAWVLALVLIGAIVLSYRVEALRPYRTGLYYVFAAAALSAVLVNVLKRTTHVNCPWDLVRYGGARTYAGLFGRRVGESGAGKCFPAGHASAGYCWFGLYFFARRYFPRWRHLAIAVALGLGLVFGTSQQLRGAHFLSHDIWTAWLTWTTAALLSPIFFNSPKTWRSSSDRGPLPTSAIRSREHETVRASREDSHESAVDVSPRG